MSTEVKVPSVGESITDGTIVSWLKKSGDRVEQGENLFELETEKAVLEIPAPAAGVLETLVDEGSRVRIGQTVAMIGEGGEPPKRAPEPKKDETATSPAPQARVAEPAPPPAAPRRQHVTPPVSASRGERHFERVPMTAIRKRTAERLVQARREAAHLTTFNEIDMGKVVDIRHHYRERFEKEHGIRIGFMSFFVKAVCQSLKEFPALNSRVDGDDIIYHRFYDIGVAVAIEGGLIVPVIRDADRMHFAEIETAIADLARRASEKKLAPEELTGGTFTITNGGVFGSLMSTPIPAYPQTAILGMHAIKRRPVVVDDAIVARPMMYAALTYDHRVIDGREAIGFLTRIKEYIEEPDKLLLEL